MTPSHASSTSSTNTAALDRGVEVAGFRVERELGRGPRATVYEAMQISLERRVALKIVPPDPRLAERFRRLRWPEHRHVVSMYAAGTCEYGQFVAMQLVRGPTLSELQDAGELEPARALTVLSEVASALDAAHATGIVHGSVKAGNVFVAGEGGALVSDFALGPERATPASDITAFAALVGQCLGDRLPAWTKPSLSSAAAIVRSAEKSLPEAVPPARDTGLGRRRRRALALGAGGLAALAVLAVVLARPGSEAERAPPVLPGVQVLGSTLPAEAVTSLDCEGRPPSGGSGQCTLVQTRLPGRPLVARQDGAVRRWAVRGASGELALQLFRRRRDVLVPIARTPYERVPDDGVHVLPASLAIRAGDRVGVQLAPGAAIGVRRDVRGGATARWLGSLVLSVRPADRGEGSGFDHELLLRVEYVPGARPGLPGRLTGRAAELAPRGRKLRELVVEAPDGRARTVMVVRAEGRIAVDLLDGERRLARLPVPDANPSGRPVALNTFGPPLVRLRWRNPDAQTVSHDYAVGARSLTPRS
jgi:Protein kinase domain